MATDPKDSNETEIALFPIPNMVTFPGAKVPLHVFEPRYRVMVKEAVRLRRRIGVCHVRKVVSRAPSGQAPEEKLNRNQDTYEPHKVFSAGFCEIMDITDDGRIYAEVTMDGRYIYQKTLQDVPYKVAQCLVYEDVPMMPLSASDGKTQERLQGFRDTIEAFLLRASDSDDGAIERLLIQPGWKQQSLEAFSFSIFQVLKFDPESMQILLELQSPESRLSRIVEFLKDAKKD